IARFVSPAPTSSRKIFAIEVLRVISQGAAQRPLAIVHSSSGFNSLSLNISLPLDSSGPLDGLTIGGSGYSSGVGLASGTTGSGLASGTTGSTGDEGNDPTYPLTLGIEGCPLAVPLYSYNMFSFSASSEFFSRAPLTSVYSGRLVDSSWVVAPGAAALDSRELARICGISLSLVKSLNPSYFVGGMLYRAGVGPQPPALGIGGNARFWSDVMNTERSTVP